MRLRVASVSVALSVLAVSRSVLASPEADGHGGGITFFSPIAPLGEAGTTGLVWTIANFLILLYILNKLLFIPLRKRTADKHDTIKSQLEAATEARQEAERLVAEYRDRTERLDDEIAELMKEAEARAETDRQRVIAEAEAEAERIKSAARAQAERDGQRLRRELEVEIIDQAVAKAEEVLRRSFGAADQRTLVDGYVDEVQRANLGGVR